MTGAMSPQVQDGHVRIANELYDAILRFGFTGRQLHVLLAIIRKTYGFSKKSDDLAASQIGLMCGISRNHVTSTLNQLAGMNVISKSVGVYGSIVAINKNYSAWIALEKLQAKQLLTSPESGQVDSPENGQGSPKSVRSPESVQGVPKVEHASPESGQVDSPEKGHTTTNFPTNNQQKKTLCANADAFSRFWTAYPKKKSKGQAEKTFAKINPDEQLMTEILSGIERAKKSRDWLKDGGAYIPHPSTWLNARGWEDEIDAADCLPAHGAMHGKFASQDYRAGVGADGSF